MNKDQIEGAAKGLGGKIQEEVGKLVDSPGQQAKGLNSQLQGKLQKKIGDLQEVVKEIKNL